MKKFYLTLFAVVTSLGFVISQGCTINPGAQTTPGVNPTPDNLPCVIRTVAYDQTIQAQIDTAFDTTLNVGISVNAHFHIDSLSLDSVAGLPTGLTWAKNPDILMGGGNGCVRISGTTSDPVGRYYITGFGRVWTRAHAQVATFTIDTPYAYSGNLNDRAAWGNYYVDVINQGGQCHVIQGINDFNSDLNSLMKVYPNPSNGVINFALDAGNRVNGELRVLDVAGKVVFNQKLDVIGYYSTVIDLSNYSKGLYTVQLRTTEGIAAKNISVE